MRAVRLRVSTFARAQEGVSAIEFSLILPVLIVLMLAGIQVVLYINATRKVQKIANSISEMLSQAAPATSAATTASVTASDLDFGYDSALVIFPYVMVDAKRQGISWRSDLTVSMAGISFQKKSGVNVCVGLDQSGCYDANVDWTSAGTSSSAFRPCGKSQIAVDNSARYSRTNLPRSLYGQGSIVAVDVTFTFNPTFGSSLVNPITITRSAFLQPRYVQSITFDPTNTDGIAITCPSAS